MEEACTITRSDRHRLFNAKPQHQREVLLSSSSARDSTTSLGSPSQSLATPNDDNLQSESAPFQPEAISPGPLSAQQKSPIPTSLQHFRFSSEVPQSLPLCCICPPHGCALLPNHKCFPLRISFCHYVFDCSPGAVLEIVAAIRTYRFLHFQNSIVSNDVNSYSTYNIDWVLGS